MTTTTKELFLQWVSTKGLELDPQYPGSADLKYESGKTRFWVIPEEPQRRPYFLAALIDLMGDWKSCHVWRHRGHWPDPNRANSRRINDLVELRILAGLGIPLGSDAVLEFQSQERDAIITLLFSTTIFGYSCGHDLYVVPDHAQQILKTDHHNVVHVSVPSGGDLQQWISTMSQKGFDLPDEPPDWTFKRPPWMGGDVR